MKKHVVVYKKLSPPLMARLEAQAHVTLIETLDTDGLAQLCQALPHAQGPARCKPETRRRAARPRTQA